MQYPFYSEVEVISVPKQEKDIKVGDAGWVIGISDSVDGQEHEYGVFFWNSGYDRCVCFSHNQLKLTGNQKKIEDFYSGKSIRVDEYGNILSKNF